MHNGNEHEVLEVAARYFRLLSDATRLRILHAICHGERPVSAIVAATGCTQSNVSRNLSLMHDLGVLVRRKAGTSVYYGVADPMLTDLCDTVCTRLARRLARSGRATPAALPRPHRARERSDER